MCRTLPIPEDGLENFLNFTLCITDDKRYFLEGLKRILEEHYDANVHVMFEWIYF